MPEETISTRRIFEGRAINLRIDTIRTPEGGATTREIVEHIDCVCIVPVDAQDNVLLVRQYRKAVEKELLEIPAGGIEAGETPEDAVRREMREETGFLPRRMERLGGFYSSPGFCTEYLHLYVATDLVSSPLMGEDTDEIKVERVPVKEIRRLIQAGKFLDTKSIAGLYMFLDWRGVF